MEAKLRKVIHHTEEQILVLDLGLAERDMEDFVASIGKDFCYPARALVV